MEKTKRRILFFVIVPLAALLFFSAGCKDNSVGQLHKEAVVWDTHNDLAYRVLYEGLDIGNRLPAGHVDIPRLQEGGVDVQVAACFVQNFLYPDRCDEQAFRLIRAMREAIEKNSDSAELARTGADVERILESGRIAIPLSVEGGHAIEDNLDILRKFSELGVSSMTLTHNITHGWADSSGDQPRWEGLNDFGRLVVLEMNRLDMVIDVSHVSDDTFFDVLEVTEDPVIFSHSGCRALNPHHRNVSDDMLRALKTNGGVIGIVFVLPFLTSEYNQAKGELEAVGRPWHQKVLPVEDEEQKIALEHLNAGRDWPLENLPSLKDVLDHIDHAVKIAGADHVGLGADMYPRTPSPAGIAGVQDYPNITGGLRERGYSNEDIRKIMGGNFLRVWKQVTDR